MSDLRASINRFLDELRRKNSSPHTIKSYGSDLEDFLQYFTLPDLPPPEPSQFDLLSLREWLASLHERGVQAVTIRRKVAALRMYFRFLIREGEMESNPARLLRLPKLPYRVPSVPDAEKTNTLLDGVAAATLERPFPKRDLAIFELLYGCGLRVSELVGLDLQHVDANDHWILARGKGRKERQVPVTGKAWTALEIYLRDRGGRTSEDAVFLNHRGARLTDRAVRNFTRRDWQEILPCIHIVSAMRMRRICCRMERTCARFKNCWATHGFQPRRGIRKCR
jgi:integrase/recombinase XerC